MARPELVDNRPANTHGDALDSLARDERPEHGLSAATGYVNLAGLRHLALATQNGRAVRLMLGAAPASHRESSPFEVFNDYFAELHDDRNMAGFPPSRAARELGRVLDWLRRPNVQVRRYLKQFLHGKAYLFGDVEESRAALVTSANLTAAGLFGNLELGLAHYQPNVTKAALEWFDALWNEAPDFKDELVELLGTAALHLADPWMVFLRALLELFGDDPADTVAQPGKVNLAAFQWDGYPAGTSDRQEAPRGHLRRRCRHGKDRDRPRVRGGIRAPEGPNGARHRTGAAQGRVEAANRPGGTPRTGRELPRTRR